LRAAASWQLSELFAARRRMAVDAPEGGGVPMAAGGGQLAKA